MGVQAAMIIVGALAAGVPAFVLSAGAGSDSWEYLVDQAKESAWQGQFAEARTALLQALEYETNNGRNALRLASTFANLGEVHDALGRAAESERFYRRSLALLDRHARPEDSALAVCLARLGSVLVTRGRRREAEPLLRRALSIWEASGRTDERFHAWLLNEMGTLYEGERRYDAAARFFRQALRTYRTSAGAESAQAAVVLGNLASLASARGDRQECSRHLLEAVAILERTLAPNHVWLATAFARLAIVYFRVKEYSEADLLLSRAARIFERNAPDHPTLGGILNYHSKVLARLGRRRDATEMRRRAQAILEKAAGSERHVVDWRDLAR